MEHVARQMKVDCSVYSLRSIVRELTELAADEKSVGMVMAEFGQLEHSRNRLQWLCDLLTAFKQQQVTP